MKAGKRLIAGTVLAALCCGCTAGRMDARGEGALGGAAIGAASGAIVGSTHGHAGEAAIVGGAIGAIAGAIIGDSVEARRQRRDRDQALAEEFRRQNFEAYGSDRGVTVNFPDVLFEFGRAELTPNARRKVATIAGVLRRPDVAWRRVSVEGHTDSIGSEQANLMLSQKRARSVADALARMKIAPSRLTIHAFGEAYPVAPNVHGDGSDDPQGRAKNRRVEVVILSETEEGAYPQQQGQEDYPQYEQGEQEYPQQPQAGPGYPEYPQEQPTGPGSPQYPQQQGPPGYPRQQPVPPSYPGYPEDPSYGAPGYPPPAPPYPGYPPGPPPYGY